MRSESLAPDGAKDQAHDRVRGHEKSQFRPARAHAFDVKGQDGNDDPVAEHDHEQDEGQDIEIAFRWIHS